MSIAAAIRTSWFVTLLAVAIVAAPAPASANGPQLITFDELMPDTPGLVVGAEYAMRGVTFNGPRAFENPNLAHSAPVAVKQCAFVVGACSTPVAMTFAGPQRTVGAYVGFTVDPPGSVGVVLSVRNAAGLVAQQVATITSPEEHAVLEIARPEHDITSAEVSLVLGPGLDSNEGLFVDNVFFDDTPQTTSAVILTSLPNPAAAGAPVAYEATVGPAPPGGTVAFADGGVPIPGCEAVAFPAGSPSATCTVTYAEPGTHAITARFSGAGDLLPSDSSTLHQEITPAEPAIGDALLPVLPDDLPEPTRTLAVSVSGGGTVVETGPAGRRLQAATRRIACGVGGFKCAVDVSPGRSVTLQARPADGYRFRGWSGTCQGARRTCTVLLRFVSTVTARFERSDGRPSALAAGQPRVTVRWRQSVGRGTLRVSGRLLQPAQVRIELRRPDLRRGAIVIRKLRVPAGRFTRTIPLTAATLPRGLKLLPGAFIISTRGSAGGDPLPLQLQSLVVRPPREGVVRTSYVTAAEGARAVLRLPAGATEAWAHFKLAAQAVGTLPLAVTWYRPDGRALGTIAKSNRPEVASYLRSNVPIPTGRWVAELRAGKVVVQRLSVRVGV